MRLARKNKHALTTRCSVIMHYDKSSFWNVTTDAYRILFDSTRPQNFLLLLPFNTHMVHPPTPPSTSCGVVPVAAFEVPLE